MDLKARPGPSSLLVCPEVADKDGSLESSPGCSDCSSDTSFVTAVEASEAKDPACHTYPWAGPLPRQQLLPHVRPSQRVLKSPDTPQLEHGAIMTSKEAELKALLQALTLTSPSLTSLPDRSPAHCPPPKPLPGPLDFHFLTDDQWALDSEVGAPWLTEDEAPPTGGRDPVPSCGCLPVMSDLELLQRLRALGESPGPVTPFTRPRYLRRLEEAQAAPG